MEAKHTAGPWHLIDNGMYFEIVVPWKSAPNHVDQYSPKICTVSYEDNDGIIGRPNAEFIVRACNAHDDLVKALQTARNGIVWYMENTDQANECDHEALAEIDAALAKATGAA